MKTKNYYLILLISFTSIISFSLFSFPSNASVENISEIDNIKFSISSINPSVIIFKSNNSFWYKVRLVINVFDVQKDNLTIGSMAGGDMYSYIFLKSYSNYTMNFLTPEVTLGFISRNTNGTANGTYSLSIGKKTLYPGISYPLIMYFYEIFRVLLKDNGLQEQLGIPMFITLLIIFGIVLISINLYLKNKIKKEEDNKSKFVLIFYFFMIFTVILPFILFIPLRSHIYF